MTANDQNQERMPDAVWWLVGAFGVLVVIALFYALPREQEELSSRAREAVEESGMSVSVSVEGRDAYLDGRVATFEESEVVVAAVNAVEGIRFVHADVTYLSRGGVADEESVGSALAADPNPALFLGFGPDVMVVRGRYPDDDSAADLLQAAVAIVGSDGVRDQMVTSSAVVAEPWIEWVPAMLVGLGELTDGSVSFGTDTVVISGEVASPESKDRIGSVVADAVGDVVVVTNSLVVVPLTPVEFHAASSEGQVVLAGLLPDEESVASVIDAATAAYGEANVANLLEVGPKVESPAWLASVPELIAASTELETWSFDITSSGAAFTARGPDDASIELAAATVGGLSAVGLEVTSDVERSATSVATELTGILEGSATFTSGSTRLSAEATELLDEAVVILLANPSTGLTIEGHTDDVGGDAANLELSQARADAVAAYLIAGGVAEIRLVAIGFGETVPIADNGTAEGRAANRRIVFVVKEGDN